MKRFYSLISTVATGSILLMACAETSEKQVITLPNSTLNADITTPASNPDLVAVKDARLIPACAFVEQTGKPVNGEVAFRYREFSSPAEPTAFDPNGYTFDLNFDFNRFPELRELAGVMWQYAGETQENDPELHPSILRKPWTNVSVIPFGDEFGVYTVTLIVETADENGKVDEERFQTILRPVFRGKCVSEANDEFKAQLAVFNAQAIDRGEEAVRLDIQEKLLRSFAMDNIVASPSAA
jgi:hypothetical protein